MSGHSKWSTIKRQKGATDAKRAASFTRMANMVAVAAKEGGGDPGLNFKLKIAIDQARSVNMPKENIERAIKRGTGELGGAAIESAMYEAFGPGNVGFLIEAATDNKNRTIGDVKTVLTKNGGKQANAGSVSFQFAQKGRIIAQFSGTTDEGELAIIDAGAEDYEQDDSNFVIYTSPTDLMQVKTQLETNGFTIEEAVLTWEPETLVDITDLAVAQGVTRLQDALENLDDVTNIYTNAHIDGNIEV